MQKYFHCNRCGTVTTTAKKKCRYCTKMNYEIFEERVKVHIGFAAVCFSVAAIIAVILRFKFSDNYSLINPSHLLIDFTICILVLLCCTAYLLHHGLCYKRKRQYNNV